MWYLQLCFLWKIRMSAFILGDITMTTSSSWFDCVLTTAAPERVNSSVFPTSSKGVVAWHRLVRPEGHISVRRTRNRRNELLQDLNSLSPWWMQWVLSFSRSWRLLNCGSVPEERVWQSGDGWPQVLRWWQIHLRPQSGLKNQVRSRLWASGLCKKS